MDFKWICLLTSKKYSLLRRVSNSNLLVSPKCVPTSKEKVWWNVHAFQKKCYEWNDCTLEYLNTTIKIPRYLSRIQGCPKKSLWKMLIFPFWEVLFQRKPVLIINHKNLFKSFLKVVYKSMPICLYLQLLPFFCQEFFPS